MLGLLAGKTERIALGSGLMQIPARQPAATAMAAASLDVISGGRFRLGLGVSGPQVSEGWYGVPFARPLARTREYVEIVRKALAREPLEHEGASFTRRRLTARDRAGQAAQAARQARPGADPDLPRRDRPEGGRADRARSPTAGCRSCSTRPTRDRCSSRCDRGAAKAGRSLRRHRRLARRPGGRRRGPRRGARRRARRGWRSTSARWARRQELLRRAGRALRARRLGARVPGARARRRPRRARSSAITDELIDAACDLLHAGRAARPPGGLRRCRGGLADRRPHRRQGRGRAGAGRRATVAGGQAVG